MRDRGENARQVRLIFIEKKFFINKNSWVEWKINQFSTWILWSRESLKLHTLETFLFFFCCCNETTIFYFIHKTCALDKPTIKRTWEENVWKVLFETRESKKLNFSWMTIIHTHKRSLVMILLIKIRKISLVQKLQSQENHRDSHLSRNGRRIRVNWMTSGISRSFFILHFVVIYAHEIVFFVQNNLSVFFRLEKEKVSVKSKR